LIRTFLIGLLLFFSRGTAVSIAQSPQDDDGKAILDVFAAQRIPQPMLGWVLPNGELVTEVVSSEVTVFAEGIAPKVAPQIGVIPIKSVLAYVKKNEADCDQLNEDKPVPLYRYDAKMPKSKVVSQVFVSGGRLGLALNAGFVEFKATEPVLEPVWREMRSKPGQRRLARSVGRSEGTYFYTIAATFMQDGRLLRKGLFLQDRSGKIVGKKIENVNGEEECDGCAVLKYRDGLKYIYPVLNLITLPGLPYPVLMEDSSGVEGRAIDLFTFTSTGTASQYRIYEYMVTCIIGSDSSVTSPKSH